MYYPWTTGNWNKTNITCNNSWKQKIIVDKSDRYVKDLYAETVKHYQEDKRHTTQNTKNKNKIWQSQITRRIQSSRSSHTPLVRIQNGAAALENNFSVPFKVKYILTVRFSNCIPRYRPKLNYSNTHTKICT